MDRKTLTSLNEAALQVQQNEAATHLPDSPDVVKYYGGRKRFDKLVAELKKKYESNKNKKNKQNFPSGGLTPAGKKWMEQGTQKKTDESVELALEYFENYFGGSLNESVSDEDIMEAVYFLIDLTEAVLDAVGLNEK